MYWQRVQKVFSENCSVTVLAESTEGYLGKLFCFTVLVESAEGWLGKLFCFTVLAESTEGLARKAVLFYCIGRE